MVAKRDCSSLITAPSYWRTMHYANSIVVVVIISGMQLQVCVAPYVDIILHRGQFWAKSAASESVRWCCFRSFWMMLSHVMRGRPGCLLQYAGGGTNRILLAFALSSVHMICPNSILTTQFFLDVLWSSTECGKRSFSYLAATSGMDYLLMLDFHPLSTPLNAVWKLIFSNSPSTPLPCCPPSDCQRLWFSTTTECACVITACITIVIIWHKSLSVVSSFSRL